MFTRTSASTNGGVPRPSWPCPELVLSEGTRYVDHILCIVHYPIYNRRSDGVSGRIRVVLIFLSSPFLSLLFSPTTVPRGTPLPASLVFPRSRSLSFSPSQPPPTSPVFLAPPPATYALKELAKSTKACGGSPMTLRRMRIAAPERRCQCLAIDLAASRQKLQVPFTCCGPKIDFSNRMPLPAAQGLCGCLKYMSQEQLRSVGVP